MKSVSDERRRSQRFILRLPVEVAPKGSRVSLFPGETQNISSGGVLLSSEVAIETGEPVEFTVTLMQTTRRPMVVLHCWGRVLRKEIHGELALSIERYELVRKGN